MSSARDAIAEATRVLARAGIGSARVDAELLAEHAFGVPRGRLALVDPDPYQLELLRELVERRSRRVPVQHLTGRAPFRYLDLAVGPGVFIPRPETELLVDWGLATLSTLSTLSAVDAVDTVDAVDAVDAVGAVGAVDAVDAPVVVDLASGSGAIALAVATEYPQATVHAVERSPEALAWLRRNASAVRDATGIDVSIVDGDVTDPETLSDLDGRVDLVLCNPPYVPDAAPVEEEVRGYDPAEAVFGGADGLDVIRPVIARVVALLRPGGWVGIEHDDSHGVAVPDLLRGAGAFDAVREHADLAGRPRFATARRLADFSP